MFGTSWTCWQGMDVHATLRGFNYAESTWLILNNRAQKSQNVAKDIQRLSLWRSVLVNSCEFLGRYLAVLDYPALRARLWRYLPWRSVPQASPAVMRWCRAIELLTSTSFLGCPWSMNLWAKINQLGRVPKLSIVTKNQTPDLSMQGLAFGAHDFLTVTFRAPRELEEQDISAEATC